MLAKVEETSFFGTIKFRKIIFQTIFSRHFMKWNAAIIVTFFNPHELTKIVLESFLKLYGVKLNYLAKATEPKWFFLFFRVTYNTGRD